MHYCDGSSGDSSSSVPPTTDWQSTTTTGQPPGADNSSSNISSTSPGSSIQNLGSTGKAAGKQQPSSIDSSDEDEYCDDGDEADDQTPGARAGSSQPKM